MTGYSFDDFVTTVTQDHYIPKVVDTVLSGNVITMRLLNNAESWSGEKIIVPIKVTSSSANGSFNPYDVFDTTRNDTRVKMEFGPRAAYQSVTISGLEEAVNKGKEKVLDLVRTEMESAEQDFADILGDQMYSDGTGNGGADIDGLIAAVDDSSNVDSYGGLSRTTYTTIQSYYVDLAGALTLTALATLIDATTYGTDRPTLIVTTIDVWSDYEALLQPTIRMNLDAVGLPMVTKSTPKGGADRGGNLKGDVGFAALMFRGIPIVADQKCPSGNMWALNEKYLKWYALEHADNVMVKPTSENIEGVYTDQDIPVVSWTGWKKPVNQDAKTGQFIIYGNLINRNPNRSGRIIGIV